jgi:hypothetical protein
MVEWRPPGWRRVPGHSSDYKRALQHNDNAEPAATGMLALSFLLFSGARAFRRRRGVCQSSLPSRGLSD